MGQEDITAEKAYRLNKVEGVSQTEIAEQFDCGQSTVSRLVRAYEDGKEAGVSSVQENPEDYLDMDELIGDSETRNPRAKCPSCNTMIPRPESAGEHDCPICGATLGWSESEVA